MATTTKTTAKAKTNRAAVNDGTCQVCGSRQKLPAGRIAKHGYTTQFGFFSGTCIGSDELPFEQSTDVIEEAIRNAEEKKDLFAHMQREVLFNQKSDRGWVKLYRAATVYTAGGYYWAECEFRATPFTAGEQTFDVVEFLHPGEGNRKEAWVSAHNKGIYAAENTVASYINATNLKYADFVGAQIAEIERYVAWQQKRVNEWKPQPLLPRS